jgi:hypothetical protein
MLIFKKKEIHQIVKNARFRENLKLLLSNSCFIEERIESQRREGFITGSAAKKTCLVMEFPSEFCFCLRANPEARTRAGMVHLVLWLVSDFSDCGVLICLAELRLSASSGLLGVRVPALLVRRFGTMWLSLPESQAFHLCQVTCVTTSDIIKC